MIVEIKSIEVEELADEGCNDGNHPHYTITYSNKKTGKTGTIKGIGNFSYLHVGDSLSIRKSRCIKSKKSKKKA